MNSITVGLKKQSPGKVQVLPDRHCFQQHPIEKLTEQKTNSNKKKVRFNCRTSSSKQQAFENPEDSLGSTDRSQRSIFEDHNYTSSSTNVILAEPSKINDNPICSVRATIITFIIVILIILSASIAVGIVFGTTKDRQNASEPTIGNNNQNLFSTTSAAVILSSISIGNQTGAPCSSYTTINDPSRNVAQTILFGPCDVGPLFNASHNGSWIRFVGTGGTTIPLTSPGMNHCGSYASGWFNGTLPIIVGMLVNGFVCFSIDLHYCQIVSDMSVINCGSFYVYFLPPVPICNARYCTI